MSKRIRIFTTMPRIGKTYILAPFGLYFNKDIITAERGDLIVINDGWKEHRVTFVRSCSIKVDSKMFAFMVGSLYGDGVSLRSVLERWEAVCMMEGYGKAGFSKKEILIVEFKNIENGED